MKFMFFFILVFSFAVMSSTSGNIINVPDDYGTIQEGINVSGIGDTVLVQPGTYVENINFNGHNIVLGSLFIMAGDTSHISQTIIDGNSAGSVVTFDNGEDNTASIIGFSLVNGFGAIDPDSIGGAVTCLQSNPLISYNKISQNTAPVGAIYCIGASSLVISENLIYSNTGSGINCYDNSDAYIFNNEIWSNTNTEWAAGIYVSHSEPVISENFIHDNTGFVHNGGIALHISDAIIEDNTISSNHTDSDGNATAGAISCNSSNAVIQRNIISDNSTGKNGGGIVCTFSNSIIRNNLIINNYASLNGGAIDCRYSDPIIANNTICNNTSGYGGGGIFSSWGSNPVLLNSIVRDNSPQDIALSNYGDSTYVTIQYSNLEGGLDSIEVSDIGTVYWLEGNLTVDPLFRDPENSDFHLMATYCGDPFDSPCIDAGYPAIFDSLLDCSWGLGEQRSDMGAFAGIAGWVGIEGPIEIIPTGILLSQNYPNPFNSSTVISYSLPISASVSIEIYNILGRKVDRLLNLRQQAGSHQVIWNADNYPSGIYFYIIQAGDIAKTNKMMLVK